MIQIITVGYNGGHLILFQNMTSNCRKLVSCSLYDILISMYHCFIIIEVIICKFQLVGSKRIFPISLIDAWKISL